MSAGGVDGSSDSSNHPKLSLGLDFSSMDFRKVASSTLAARRSDADNKVTAMSGFISELDGLQATLSRPPNPDSITTTADHKKSFHKTSREASSPRRATLHEVLNDCLSSGNWIKAVKYFGSAVDASRSEIRKRTPEAHEQISINEDDAILERAFEPMYSNTGIGRWQGNHFRTVITSLFAAEATDAFRSVWRVLLAAKAPQKKFDAFIANGLLPLVFNRPDHQVANIYAQSTKKELSPEEKKIALDRWKATKRSFACDLGTIAELMEWRLLPPAIRAVEFARGIDRSQAKSGTVDASAVIRNDFHALLEKAVSEEAVDNIVTKMKSIGCDWNDQTYLILLRRMKAAVSSERALQPEAASSTTSAVHDPTSRGPSGGRWQNAIELLHLYKRNHPATCPSPPIVNDALWFIKNRKEHDVLVYSVLGLLTKSPVHPMTAETTVPHEKVQWEAFPNSKTFEVLIRHTANMGRRDESWFWFDEMSRLKIKGTGVTYHSMIQIASSKPAGAADVMEVYRRMKEVGKDVNHIDTTVSLINAWSTRQQSRQRRF
jgi:hypothetical protein